MIIAVASGKGGTGKTTVLGSFAALAPAKVLADAVGEATAEAVPLVEWNQGAAAKALRALWDDVASWRAL